jgi:hypothetical protein
VESSTAIGTEQVVAVYDGNSFKLQSGEEEIKIPALDGSSKPNDDPAGGGEEIRSFPMPYEVSEVDCDPIPLPLPKEGLGVGSSPPEGVGDGSVPASEDDWESPNVNVAINPDPIYKEAGEMSSSPPEGAGDDVSIDPEPIFRKTGEMENSALESPDSMAVAVPIPIPGGSVESSTAIGTEQVVAVYDGNSFKLQSGEGMDPDPVDSTPPPSEMPPESVKLDTDEVPGMKYHPGEEAASSISPGIDQVSKIDSFTKEGELREPTIGEEISKDPAYLEADEGISKDPAYLEASERDITDADSSPPEEVENDEGA